MKNLVLGTIVIAALLLFGCNDGAKNNQAGSSGSPSSTSTSSPTDSMEDLSTSDVKIYTDETYKQIQYGKLTINMDVFHIVSSTRIDDTEIFKCEIDKGETRPESHMDIKVEGLGKIELPDTQSIITYLTDIAPDYNQIWIYSNVTDDSGITSLYRVAEGDITYYIVNHMDASYLVESDNNILEGSIFVDLQRADYEVNKLEIECADSFVTSVIETFLSNEGEFEKGKYDIVQGKDGRKYSAELSVYNEDYIRHFTLNSENGENLLMLSIPSTADQYSAMDFVDINRDGYADIQVMEEDGAMNSSFALYIWDDSAMNFVKVKCDEMLSYFEVHDGYLLNWAKENSNSGVVQKLVWLNKATLMKESEEPYHAD